jgi:hypothetical protein
MHPWLVPMLTTCLALLIFIQFVLSTSPQSPFEYPRNSTGFRGLQQLHDGNQKFRDSLTQGTTVVQQGLLLFLFLSGYNLFNSLLKPDPGFMIIGCTDSRYVYVFTTLRPERFIALH